MLSRWSPDGLPAGEAIPLLPRILGCRVRAPLPIAARPDHVYAAWLPGSIIVYEGTDLHCLRDASAIKVERRTVDHRHEPFPTKTVALDDPFDLAVSPHRRQLLQPADV